MIQAKSAGIDWRNLDEQAYEKGLTPVCYDRRKVTGVLQSDWSAAIQDYPIASGWTHDGGALVVCDSAGGVRL